MKLNYKILLLIILFILISLGIFNKNSNKNMSGKISDEIIEENVIQEPIRNIIIEPQVIYPGDPILITINSSTDPLEVVFDNKELKIFEYENFARAFAAIDFYEEELTHTLKITFENGDVEDREIKITPREKIEKPLGIPDKLGGNTTESAKNLVKNLAEENYILNTVKTATSTFWEKTFEYPLKDVFVTDDYGYDRKTVDQTIVHKGTDFRAAVGTPVMAMNEGVVRVARKFTIYGNSIIIDHGLGVQTLYMHLSKINVKEGDVVNVGDVIGLSGDTGYVNAAHLHISVKIDSVSIDPMTFMNFFKK